MMYNYFYYMEENNNNNSENIWKIKNVVNIPTSAFGIHFKKNEQNEI